MLKAAALYYAIIVALLIGLMSGSVILFAQYNRFETIQFELQRRLINNANSGVNWLIGQENIQDFQEPKDIDLYGEGIDSVVVRGSLWGLFKVVSARAKFKKHRFSKSAMVGLQVNSTEQPVLFLADRNRPLSLCGETLIRGKAMLPKAGVKRAYIEGQSFNGDKLISGSISHSSRSLPQVNNKLIKANEAFFSITPKTDTLIYWDDQVFDLSLSRTFDQSTVSIIPSGYLRLAGNAVLDGNIRILSSGTVVISPDAQANNIVIYAREISVEQAFNGRLQIFASHLIEIGQDCDLKYPSSVCLLPLVAENDESKLEIQEGSTLSGIVFSGIQKKRGPAVKVAKEAIIHGSVYSRGSIQLKGSIHGNLVCEKFYLKTPSSVYENHLLNAVIDQQAKSAQFVDSYLFTESSESQIVQWLN